MRIEVCPASRPGAGGLSSGCVCDGLLAQGYFSREGMSIEVRCPARLDKSRWVPVASSTPGG